MTTYYIVIDGCFWREYTSLEKAKEETKFAKKMSPSSAIDLYSMEDGVIDCEQKEKVEQ